MSRSDRAGRRKTGKRKRGSRVIPAICLVAAIGIFTFCFLCTAAVPPVRTAAFGTGGVLSVPAGTAVKAGSTFRTGAGALSGKDGILLPMESSPRTADPSAGGQGIRPFPAGSLLLLLPSLLLFPRGKAKAEAKGNGNDRIHPGDAFGSLTAMEKTTEKKNGYPVWQFRCSCGRPDCSGEVMLSSRVLFGPYAKKDCECGKTRYIDMTGQKFGKLTVLERAEKPAGRASSGKTAAGGKKAAARSGSCETCWKCRCDCGNTVIVPRRSLISGNTKSCGCGQIRIRADIQGKRFGELTVLEPVDDARLGFYWKARCSCGKETIVRQSYLLSGRTTSCGHRKYEVTDAFEGTRIAMIKNAKETVPVNNTSGVRGVYQDKGSKKWVANIGFRNRIHYIGTYDDIEDARKAREQAAEKLFGPVLEKWKSNGQDT